MLGWFQRGDRARLALEALAPLAMGGDLGGQDLDGDGAIEAGIARAPDLAHAADADDARDFVGPEPGACGEVHGVRGCLSATAATA
jgi:hypothetical protein